MGDYGCGGTYERWWSGQDTNGCSLHKGLTVMINTDNDIELLN